MIPQHHFLPINFPGSLCICPRIRGDDWLEDEIKGFKDLGFAHIVCLLTEDEELLLGLEGQDLLCEKIGISLLKLPVDDRCQPLTHRDFLGRALDILQRLEAGENVAVYSRRGTGRPALFCSSILYFHGIYPEESMEIIESVLGLPSPDSTAQREWILNLENWVEGLSDLLMDSRGLPG
mgnify:CR=1 FL=1